MTSPSQLQLRATDAERNRVAEILRSAAGRGALTVDELEERLSAAYAGVTRADLARLVEDLPPESPGAPSRRVEGAPSSAVFHQAPAGPLSAQPVLGVERNPGVIVLLSVVTVGLYLIYWWYCVNREVRDFARTAQPTHPLAGASPGMSTLALTLGSFVIVPLFVTAHATARRVGEAMSLAGLPPHDRPSAPLYMLLFTVGSVLIVPSLLFAPLLQGHLNRAWRQVRAAQPPAADDWLAAAMPS